MNLFFVICTVFGVTLLACLTLLSVLGLDQKPDFLDQNWKSGYEDLSELGPTTDDRFSEDAPSPSTKSTSQPRVQGAPLRGMGAGIAFFGLAGCAAHAVHMSLYQTFGLSVLAAILAFLGVGLLMRQLPFDPFQEGSTVGDADTIPNIAKSESRSSELSETR